MMPKVSILICTYKTSHDHLLVALRSAQAQTWSNIEILVSDDSPTREIESIVLDLNDSRIKYYFHAPSLGPAENHWWSIFECSGDYVSILNHDDCIEPTFIERLMYPFGGSPQLAVSFCDHWIIDERGKRLSRESNENTAKWGRSRLSAGSIKSMQKLVIDQTIPVAMGSVFVKDRIPKNIPRGAGPAYDLWLSYFLARGGGAAYYVPERLSSWRIHQSNLTNLAGQDWILGSALCWAMIEKDPEFKEHQKDAKKRAARAYVTASRRSLEVAAVTTARAQAWTALSIKASAKAIVIIMLTLIPKRLLKFLFKY